MLKDYPKEISLKSREKHNLVIMPEDVDALWKTIEDLIAIDTVFHSREQIFLAHSPFTFSRNYLCLK